MPLNDDAVGRSTNINAALMADSSLVVGKLMLVEPSDYHVMILLGSRSLHMMNTLHRRPLWRRGIPVVAIHFAVKILGFCHQEHNTWDTLGLT